MREKSRNIYFLQQESQGVQSNDPKALRRSRKIAFQSHYNLELPSMFGYPFHALADPLRCAFLWSNFWVRFTPQNS